MRQLYGYRLPLAVRGVGAYEEALGAVRRAVTGSVSSVSGAIAARRAGSLELDGGARLRWRVLGAPGLDDRLFTLWHDRRSERDPDFEHALVVSVALDQGAVSITVQLGLRPVGNRLAPVRHHVGPPAVVAALAEALDITEDGYRLSPDPLYVEDRAAAGELAELLLDPSRVLPVVVVTTVEAYDGDLDEYRHRPLVDADALARSLLGLAHVVVLEGDDTTYALTDALGREFSVYRGAARLYWPGLEWGGDPRPHTLWRASELTDRATPPLAWGLLRRLAPVGAERAGTVRLEARLRHAVERHRRQQMAELRARAEEASLAPEWQAELERAWDELERAQREIAELTEQLEVAQDNLRAVAMARAGDDDAGDVPATEHDEAGAGEPRSVAEAVEWAEARLPHVVVLDESHRSARDAAYRQPGRVWRALVAMEEVAQAWVDGRLPGGFRGGFVDRGFDFCPAISPMIVSRYPQEYERTYEGRKIALGPHLRLGRGPEGCRIYFYVDEENQRFVLGHVGKHLSDNTAG